MTSRRTTWAAAFAVAAITAAAFLPALHAGFVTWDDDTNFINNPAYRGFGGDHLHWMWTTFHMGHYVPLSWMTLGLDYTLWGMNPSGYHLTNLLIHAANAVAVFFVARRLLALAGSSGSHHASGTNRALVAELPAAFAALVFAIHPLRVESVVWITERRDVLSGLFASLTVLAYLRAADAEPRGESWYWAAAALFFCALLSKATPVTIPAILLILNVYPLKRVGGQAGWWTPAAKRLYARLAPFTALAAAASVMAMVALQRVDQLPGGEKIAVSAYSLSFYIWKTIAPVHLAALYKMPGDIDPLAARYLACYAIAIAVSALAWTARRKWPGAATAWLAFVVITFPMLGFHQNGPQIAADRYTYHAAPVVGIFVAGAVSAVAASSATVLPIVAAAILATLGIMTWKQTETWHDSESMWSQVLAVDSTASIAQTALGNLLLRRGDLAAAADHYRRSLVSNPRSPEAHDNLGVALAKQGRFDAAVEQYEQTLILRPQDYEAENDLGVALVHTGHAGNALDHYRRALAINPSFADAHVNWGNALAGLGKPDEAIDQYAEAVRLKPDDGDAERNWGVVLAQQGKLADAATHFQRAVAINSSDADAREYLVRASARLGQAPPAAGR